MLRSRVVSLIFYVLCGTFTNIFRYDTSRITGQLQTTCASAARIYRRRQHHILVLCHEILRSHQRICTLASKSYTWPFPKHFLHRIQAVTITTTNATTAGTPASDAHGTPASAARKACSECQCKHIRCDRPTTGAPCTGCRHARGELVVCAI
jgi:hypothetical protein